MRSSLITKNIIIDNKKYTIFGDGCIEYMDVYEYRTIQLFKKYVKKGDTVIDIGANIGLTSIFFSTIASNVFSFEPNPIAFELLEHNLKTNDITNVECYNIGVGNENKKSTITHYADNMSGGYVSEHHKINQNDHATSDITLARLDDIEWIKDFGCNLMKIDVEGYECEVIKGAKNLIEQYKPIIILEFNGKCIKMHNDDDLTLFFDTLRQYFPVLYAVEWIKDKIVIKDLYNNDDVDFVIKNNMSSMSFLNVIAGFDSNILKLLEE